MKIRQWYLLSFPEDALGNEINEDATFEGLFEVLDSYKDVYEYLGDNIDSVIRERVFAELADIMEVPYEEVYNQWLMAESTEATDGLEAFNEAYQDSYELIDLRGATKEEVEDKLVMLYNNSALTFEGLDENSIDEAVEYIIEEQPSADPHVYILSGKQMNEICHLLDDNAYPDDLTIVSILGTGSILAISIGARWLDDIINNNAMRQGVHPFDPFYKNELLDESIKLEGLGSFTINLQKAVTEEFDNNNYPKVSIDIIYKTAKEVEEKLSKKGYTPVYEYGDIVYYNLNLRQKADVDDAIIDAVDKATERLGSPVLIKKYTKGRGGFSGTATKNRPMGRTVA